MMATSILQLKRALARNDGVLHAHKPRSLTSGRCLATNNMNDCKKWMSQEENFAYALWAEDGTGRTLHTLNRYRPPCHGDLAGADAQWSGAGYGCTVCLKLTF